MKSFLLCWLCCVLGVWAQVQELRGVWKVQWPNLQANASMDSAPVTLPHLWAHQGCALYNTTVHFPRTTSQQALLVPAPLHASAVWINGVPQGGSGTASCSAHEAIPASRDRIFSIPEGLDSLQISILVSNHEGSQGGIPSAPRLGSAREIIRQVQLQRSLSYLFSGILFLIGLYHIVLSIHRRKSHGDIHFAALNLVGIYRLLGSGKVLTELFPQIPWDVWMRLDYASTGLFFALLYLFVQKALPGRLVRIPGYISVCISLSYALATALMPLLWLTPSLSYFLTLSVLGIFYILHAEIAALRQEGGWTAVLLLLTTTLFIATLVNDILSTMHILATGFYAPYGLLPLMLSHWLGLAQEYGSSYSKAERRLDEFMQAMARAISNKSVYTGAHVDRVTRISLRIALARGMPAAQMRQLRLGAVVHDLGKIHLPDDLLDKPGELDAAELAQVKSHPLKGWEMLEHVEGLAIPRLIIRHHHENWDGSGYPDHLKGVRIPLEARIVALADHWDAITSERAHRDAMPIEMARETLQNEAGKKLDPELVRVFLDKQLWNEDD